MDSFFEQNYNSVDLAEMWTVIDWNKRRAGEKGFLKKTLEKNKVNSVFESSLGDGCDSIYLIKEGFDVTSNDLDFEFIKKAKENARKENIKLNVTSFDWRELGKHFDEKSFDSVLCLGNSLTYLFKKDNQLKVLKEFYDLIKKNGILIIDERNYQYFLDKRKEILEGNFNYSKNFVYCGNTVLAFPVEITEEKVVMQYIDNKRKKKAKLILYPFKKGELQALLKETGFNEIQVFSDYKKGFNPEADFYAYVCTK